MNRLCLACNLPEHECPDCGNYWLTVEWDDRDEPDHEPIKDLPCTLCSFRRDAHAASYHGVQVHAAFTFSLGWSYTLKSSLGAYATNLTERNALRLLEPYCELYPIPVAHPREILHAAHITTPHPITFCVGTT